MAMNLSQDEDEVFTTLNTTPLVDVMLVLLIIFLLTLPVVSPSIALNLPHALNQPQDQHSQSILISIDQAGRWHGFDSVIPGRDELLSQLQIASRRSPQPEIRIRGDADVEFESVARVLDVVKEAGLVKVSFVIDPK
jgi:biopolymer transport protein ExbD